MKKFIISIVAMGCILYALSWGIDWYVSYKLQQAQDRKYVGWSDITHKQLNVDLLVIGSSRAWVQYNPAILDSALHVNSYVLGFDGSHLNRQIVKYNVYDYYQDRKPDIIVVNIDVWCMNWTYGYEREQYFPYMWSSYIREQILPIEPFTIAEKYLPLYRYTSYKGIWSILQEASNVEEPLYKGYRGRDQKWNGDVFEKIDSVRFEVDERTSEMFDEFLEARKREGIQVIFCYAPIYIGVTEKVTNLQDMYNTYQGLADKYDIPILNYNYSELSKDTKYFYNASHLNKEGSDLFSKQLSIDIDSIRNHLIIH